MKQTDVLHQVATFVSHEWHSAVTSVPAFVHSVADFVRSAPSNVWAICAFAGAASIMVTLVTLCLWPNGADAAPEREATDASGVCRMAGRGVGVAEIARHTGLSQDAVATILRASTLPRGERTAPTRKTHPTTA